MGVLACNRSECENIMCDHHSYEYGYICRECLEELQSTQPDSVIEFMDTPRQKLTRPAVDYYEVFCDD